MTRTTSSVLAHVQAERAMQTERYSGHHDSLLRDREWDVLITAYLHKPGASRYVRLVQAAALAVAAAEHQSEIGDSIHLDRDLLAKNESSMQADPLYWEPCRDFRGPASCYTNDGTGLWCAPCELRRSVLA